MTNAVQFYYCSSDIIMSLMLWRYITHSDTKEQVFCETSRGINNNDIVAIDFPGRKRSRSKKIRTQLNILMWKSMKNLPFVLFIHGFPPEGIELSSYFLATNNDIDLTNCNFLADVCHGGKISTGLFL